MLRWCLASPLNSLNGHGQQWEFRVLRGQTHAWLHLFWSVLTAPLLLSEQELWKVWKEFGSKKSLHVKVQLSFPNLSHPPLLCSQAGTGICPHCKDGKSLGSQIKWRLHLCASGWCSSLGSGTCANRRKSRECCFSLQPCFEGVNQLIKAGPAPGSVRQWNLVQRKHLTAWFTSNYHH